MDLEKFNINVSGDVKQPIEILWREGSALEQFNEKKVAVTGTIFAPLLYTLQHYNLMGGSVVSDIPGYGPIETEKPLIIMGAHDGVITFNYGFKGNKNPSIKLDEFPSDEISGAIIEGVMLFNEDIAALQINQDKFFGSKELIKLITKYAGLFASFKDARDLINNLRNLDVKFTDTVKKTNDMRGNVEDAMKQEIAFAQGELPASIIINAPLFYGTPAVKLTLEIQLERRGHEAGYSFYCMELESTKQATAKAIIDSQVADLKNLFVCIEQI